MGNEGIIAGVGFISDRDFYNGEVFSTKSIPFPASDCFSPS